MPLPSPCPAACRQVRVPLMPAGYVLQPLLKGQTLKAEPAAQANMQGLRAAHLEEHLHIQGEG